MSGSPVRRLVLDISPLAWAYILFLLLCILPMNLLWVAKGLPVLIPGLLSGLGGALAQQKIAIWRLLPVSRVDIDRARWWLGPGAGLIGLPLLMLLAVLVRVLQQRHHISWDQIALGSLAQIGVCTINTAFQISAPWVARKTGRWSVLFFLLFLVLLIRIIIPTQNHAEMQPVLTGLAIAALPAALLLFLAAGRWPLPPTGSVWTLASFAKERDTPAASQRLKGWPALAAGAWPLLAMYWGASAAYPILILVMPGMNPAVVSAMLVIFFAVQGMLVTLLPAMRLLRALPLTGWQLAVRLCALLAFIELSSLALFHLSISVLQPPQTELLLRDLLTLPLSFLFIPAALRFGPRIAVFGGGLLYILAQSFLLSYFPIPAGILPAGAAIIAMASLFWLWWEITRGPHAYRMVPLAPMRWRGV